MVLVRNITDGAGGILLREGSLLVKATIEKLLETEGIDEIFVAPPPLTDVEKEAKRRGIEDRARHMFDQHADDPVMQILARVSVDILTRRV